MTTDSLAKLTENLKPTSRMPVLFLGHGNPMNAIENNEFTEGFRNISTTIGKPAYILCISAHWETRGTFVTAMERPETIHDFGGFPKELYDVQYNAPGSPLLADEICKISPDSSVKPDLSWGLDHGAWSVIKHLYPDADVPVVELSLDYTKSPQEHFMLAKELEWLRHKGVLIIGSGNIVHNLRRVAWDKIDSGPFGYDWANEADDKIKKFILEEDYKSLINYKAQGPEIQLSVPTPEHYLPLLYAISLRSKNEELIFFNDKAVGGSLTMTSLKIGN